MSTPARALVCAAAFLGISIGGAHAQSQPLVSVKGWQNRTSPSGFQMAECKPPACASDSTIMYSFLPPNPGLTFEKYRQSTESLLAHIQQDSANRGVQVKLLGVSDASKPNLRMFKTRYVVTTPDGKQETFILGNIAGTRYLVSLTSSAATEKEAEANFIQFAAPLYLYANDKIEKDVKGR